MKNIGDDSTEKTRNAFLMIIWRFCDHLVEMRYCQAFIKNKTLHGKNQILNRPGIGRK